MEKTGWAGRFGSWCLERRKEGERVYVCLKVVAVDCRRADCWIDKTGIVGIFQSTTTMLQRLVTDKYSRLLDQYDWYCWY